MFAALPCFFCFLLNVCDHALFTEPALCCCSLRTRTRAGAPLHTSTQSLRFSEKLMYLHLKIYLFLRSHQFLNNINFKLADMLALFFNTKPGGKVKMCWMTRINKSKHRLKMFNMCHMQISFSRHVAKFPGLIKSNSVENSVAVDFALLQTFKVFWFWCF